MLVRLLTSASDGAFPSFCVYIGGSRAWDAYSLHLVFRFHAQSSMEYAESCRSGYG
jgi:hypothetical protein